jgi:hypothetical protein
MSDDCKISVSGGSDAHIQVSKKLDARASGGSDILYKGNCEVTKSSSGSSDIKKAG